MCSTHKCLLDYVIHLRILKKSSSGGGGKGALFNYARVRKFLIIYILHFILYYFKFKHSNNNNNNLHYKNSLSYKNLLSNKF